MIPIPHTYAEWAEVLAALQAGADDEAVLQAMRQGSVAWQDGVAERFSKRLIDAVNFRLDAASDKFQKALTHARGQESAVVMALLALRRELRFLAEAVRLPALPEETQSQYRQLVTEQADKMQSSLEASAKGDRSGKLSRIVRNHRVNDFGKETAR